MSCEAKDMPRERGVRKFEKVNVQFLFFVLIENV